MQIRTIPIARINPAPYNPRKDLKPGDPEYEAIRLSLATFGCVQPLVVNERTGHLVGGHQRLKVLRELGQRKVKAVIVDLPLEQEKALNLALNKVQGGFDPDKLAALLDELLQSPEVDLRSTGFELAEARDLIGELLRTDDPEDPDRPEQFDVDAAVEAASASPITKLGDLIELGRDPHRRHRLICGDSTDGATAARLMQGERAMLVATDPPYLVDYDGTNHPGAKKGRKRGRPKDWSSTYGATWDDADANPELYRRFVEVAMTEAAADNAAWYCWHASKRQPMLEKVWRDAGLLAHCQIIWVKNRGVPTRTWYLWQHEPCLMGWKQGSPPPRASPQRVSTVWTIDTLPNNKHRPDHPTPKPVEVFTIPMLQHTRRGEVCYEPFAGSGTQIIAAERLGRRCFALEISPVYCDVIVRRYIAFAGEGAISPEIAAKYRVADSRRAAS